MDYPLITYCSVIAKGDSDRVPCTDLPASVQDALATAANVALLDYDFSLEKRIIIEQDIPPPPTEVNELENMFASPQIKGGDGDGHDGGWRVLRRRIGGQT